MDSRGKIGVLILSIQLLVATHAAAQDDPIAERKARNAELERVSPVMTREKAYLPTEGERVNQNLREVQGTLSSINSTLSDLALLGTRAEQAKLLLNVDQSSRETLLALFESEAKRLESIKTTVEESTPTLKPLQVAKKTTKSDRAPKRPRAIEKVTPVVVRTYAQPDLPSKVILQVGKRDPEVFYVGESLLINDREYKIVSALPVRQSERQHHRPVYEINLLSSLGEVKTLEWE